jgi:hypothetical protein
MNSLQVYFNASAKINKNNQIMRKGNLMEANKFVYST